MKIKYHLSLLLIGFLGVVHAQQTIDQIDLNAIKPNTINKFWLQLADDGLSRPIVVPVIILKGSESSPVLGITAAIHGNELNGIGVIQQVLDEIDIDTFKGTLIAIPGLNAIGLKLHQRDFIDDQDLNRIFPGKKNGNRSQQYAYQIKTKILPKLNYLIDLHTASFGRINSLYTRGDLSNDTIRTMTLLQDCDIVLNNKGIPSAGAQSDDSRTMRAEAILMGIPSITVELGNPQVFQPEMIARGKTGLKNVLSWLKMIPDSIQKVVKPVMCIKSYWIYTDAGGFLEVTVNLRDEIKKDQLVAILKNPFGEIIKKYFSPEDGIVIGKSSNPVSMSGGRIIHLGILEKNSQ